MSRSSNAADVNGIPLFVPPQVLATVKHQIEKLAATRKEFPELITAAQHWLLARETLFMATGNNQICILTVTLRVHKIGNGSRSGDPKCLSPALLFF